MNHLQQNTFLSREKHSFESNISLWKKYFQAGCLGLLLSQAPLASGQNLSPKEAVQIFQRFPLETQKVIDTLDGPTKQGLLEVVSTYESLKAQNALPKNYIFKVEPMVIGKDRAQDLSYIENNLALAPLKPTKEVVGAGFTGFDIVNDEAGYQALVEKLFDPSEVSKWYRIGEEKRQPTAEELQDFVSRLEKTKKRWLTVKKRWDDGITKGDLKKEVYEDFQKLFTSDIQKLPEISTEAARLLFVTLGSMAYNQNLTDTENAKKIKESQVINMSTNVSWKAILTNTGVPQVSVVKILLGNDKVTLAGPDEIKKVAGLQNFTSVGLDAAKQIKLQLEAEAKLEMSSQKGEKLKAEGEKLKAEGEKLKAEGEKLKAEGEKLKAEGEKLKAEGEKLKAEGEKLKAELAAVNQRIADADKKIADADKIIIEQKRLGEAFDTLTQMSIESRGLALSVLDDVQKMLLNPQDTTLLPTINAKIEKLKQNKLKAEQIQAEFIQNPDVKRGAQSLISLIESAQNKLKSVKLG